MERFIIKKLLEWKNSPYRKPLILKGVRQVGKTQVLKEFGRRYYENTAYFNFDDLSAFKIYLVDVDLLRRLAQLAPTAFGEVNRLFTQFKGALSENYVLQTLITQFEVFPRYWTQTNPPMRSIP